MRDFVRDSLSILTFVPPPWRWIGLALVISISSMSYFSEDIQDDLAEKDIPSWLSDLLKDREARVKEVTDEGKPGDCVLNHECISQ